MTKAIDKLNKQLEKWTHRSTTLSGKIAIIKSMLIPQVTYILTTMTSPEEEKIKELERNLYKFLNNGGSEKIKRNILIGEYENGGYKMTDIKSYIKAIKITWLARLINMEGIWKSRLLEILKVNPEYLLKCNIKYEDLPFKKELKNLKLWEEIFKYWCEENYEEKTMDINKIMDQSLWFNTNIKINKRVIYWEKWYNDGFKWLADLIFMDNEGNMRLMTLKEMEEFNIPGFNIMNYNSLISAIPKEWKRLITTEKDFAENDGNSNLIDKIMDNKKPMKYIYNILRNRKCEKPTAAIEKWEREMEITLNEEYTLNGHSLNHYCTKNNRLKSFNCNFLNRNIPYNKRLHKMGKKENTTCEYCEEKEEDILHLYWNCKEIKKIWNHLKIIHDNITGKDLTLEKEKCLIFPYT
jgi:hypothetical protein